MVWVIEQSLVGAGAFLLSRLFAVHVDHVERNRLEEQVQDRQSKE